MKATGLLVLAFAAALATYAFPSQAQTTTNCTRLGNQVTCYSTGPAVTAQPNTAFLGLLLRKREQRRAEAAAAEEAEYRRALANMITDGRCEGAKTIALSRGDIELAAQITSLCTKP